MQRLNACLDRLVREQRRTVAATLDEGRARDHRIAHKLVEREDHRLFHQAVNHEPMRGRIDGRYAAVMAFEVQAGGGEIADHLVERREAPRRIFIGSRKTRAHFGLELRARTVAAVGRDSAA